jgi:regulator of RNase E activity RraA
MRHAIHPLWGPPPRIAGPAFTVRTAKHDNLMMHAAIYLAQPGDIIVVEAATRRWRWQGAMSAPSRSDAGWRAS